MCKAMEELMQDVIEKRVEEKVEQRIEQRVQEVTQEVTQKVAQKVAVATRETAQKSRLESIAAMMKKLNLTENQAMDVLDIPDSERSLYVVWLSKM